EAEALLAPEPAHDLDRLVHDAEALGDVGKLESHHLELRPGPSRADARDRTTAARLVELGEETRVHDRVAEEETGDVAADPDAPRALRQRRHGEEELVRRYLGLEHAERLEDVVIGHEDRVEAELLGELRLLDDGLQPGLVVLSLAAADLDREFHGGPAG